MSRVLRKISGMNRDNMIGGWKKLHNKELHNFYSLPSIIIMFYMRRIRWVQHVAQNEVEEQCIKETGRKAKKNGTTKNTKM
jgi:hypothetical protein